MGGGGGKINKPRAAKASIRKLTREKRKLGKKPHTRSEETLANTTPSKLRQCRTNPKANVRLSGKKRRRLARDARRLLKENTEMEEVKMAEGNDGSESCDTHPKPPVPATMDSS